MMAEKWDAIVIGGGPAGSSAATFIAMDGHKVLLLEREQFPRHRIGESLLPSTIHGICSMLGVKEEIEAANFILKKGGKFLWGKNRYLWEFKFAENPIYSQKVSYAYQVERAKFDQILLDNARRKGVDVRQNHRVLEVIINDGRAVGVKFNDARGKVHIASASYVVDAAGGYSLLANTIGERTYDSFFQNIAIYQYYLNGRRFPGETPGSDSGDILVVSFGEGWFWYIPLSKELTSVGVVVDKDTASKLLRKSSADKVFARFVEKCPTIMEMLQPASLVREGIYGETRIVRDYSYLNTRFWMPGAVLVGDAACFIDPVFSSGVHLATYSALLAARSINTCLNEALDETQCFTEFEQRYRREYAVWHEFLLSFYNVEQDENSYFWEARKILNVKQTNREAFVKLIGGLATSGEPLFANEKAYFDWVHKNASLFETIDKSVKNPVALATRLKQLQVDKVDRTSMMQRESMQLMELASRKTGNSRLSREAKKIARTEQPIFPGGLVPSPDGLCWCES